MNRWLMLYPSFVVFFVFNILAYALGLDSYFGGVPVKLLAYSNIAIIACFWFYPFLFAIKMFRSKASRRGWLFIFLGIFLPVISGMVAIVKYERNEGKK